MEEEQHYYRNHNDYAPILTCLKSGLFVIISISIIYFVDDSCTTQGFSFEMKRREKYESDRNNE
jgi:hypothetical protein